MASLVGYIFSSPGKSNQYGDIAPDAKAIVNQAEKIIHRPEDYLQIDLTESNLSGAQRVSLRDAVKNALSRPEKKTQHLLVTLSSGAILGILWPKGVKKQL